MLECLDTPGYENISKPDGDVIHHIGALVKNGLSPVVAEIGIGIGATTVRMAEILGGKGEIHIFDFANKVETLKRELEQRGFGNVIAHGNSRKYWDSYHWSLGRLIEERSDCELFDLVYLDGAHTYLHDALAFFQCDRLLKVGGLMVFDDYEWRYAGSKFMSEVRHNYMTDEQIGTAQIKLFIDTLVKTHTGYKEIKPNKTFRKVKRSHI